MSGAKSAPGGLTATARESDTNRRNGSEAATLQMSHRLQSRPCSCNKQPSQGYLLSSLSFYFYEVPQSVGCCDPVQ